MSAHAYLYSTPLEIETDPAFKSIVRYGSHDAMDALPFVGSLRKHPYDKTKCLLLESWQDSADKPYEASILEFKISDIVGIDGLATPVDEGGTALAMVKLWVRRGSVAVRYEPFEVRGDNAGKSSGKLHEYLAKAFAYHDAKR